MNDEIEEKESEEKTDQPAKNEPADKPDQGEKDEVKQDQGPVWVSDLDSYPLRKKEEDPPWAIRTVWIWVGIALACFAGILLLLVLGAIYD